MKAQAELQGKATALYRHFDAAGSLLYVGISLNAIARLSQHKQSKWSADIAKVEIEHYPTLRKALEAEKLAIQAEKPRWNVTHANKPFQQPADFVPSWPTRSTGEKEANIKSIEMDVWMVGRRTVATKVKSVEWQ